MKKCLINGNYHGFAIYFIGTAIQSARDENDMKELRALLEQASREAHDTVLSAFQRCIGALEAIEELGPSAITALDLDDKADVMLTGANLRYFSDVPIIKELGISAATLEAGERLSADASVQATIDQRFQEELESLKSRFGK